MLTRRTISAAPSGLKRVDPVLVTSCVHELASRQGPRALLAWAPRSSQVPALRDGEPLIADLRHSPHEADVLIVGSGPVGCSIARVTRDLCPQARILMLDAGGPLGASPGGHLKNLPAPAPAARPVFLPDQLSVGSPSTSRLGTFLTFGPKSDLPGFVHARNVGGHGVRWTAATPRPDPSEREPWIDPTTWEQLLDAAERILHVARINAETGDATGDVLSALTREYSELAPPRQPQVMPAAIVVTPSSVAYTGPRTILGSLVDEPAHTFCLTPWALCTRLDMDGRRVRSVQVLNLHERQTYALKATVVVVAADAVHTPQLLWASGIRPTALGRYAAEHPLILASAAWPGRPDGALAPSDSDRTAAMLWVPFSSAHPFHGQLMLFDQQPPNAPGPDRAPPNSSVIGLAWLVPPSLDRRNRLDFSAGSRDRHGLPRPRIRYPLSNYDQTRITEAIRDQDRCLRALGGLRVPGGEPRVLPRGSSLHLLGTFRGGATDDGSSVCDPHGRIWGTSNLFAAGNGILSRPAAGNPTLSSVAVAVHTAGEIARCL